MTAVIPAADEWPPLYAGGGAGLSNDREWVKVGGVDLGWTTEGAGVPLLVVGSSIYYPRTFSRDLRRSCSLKCADLPHFVRTDPALGTDHINFDFYAECIEAIRSAAGLGRVVVVGHSHHGNVAVEYAKRYPRNVSHLVLIGSPPVDVSRTIRAAERYWISSASEERKAILEERRGKIDERQLALLSPSQAYVQRYVADAPLYWNDPTYDASWLWEGMTFDMEAVHAFRDLYREYELPRSPDSINTPMLVIMGEHDYAVPHTLWEATLSNLQNVSFRLLDQSGHTPQLEQPEEFDRILLGWLQEERKP